MIGGKIYQGLPITPFNSPKGVMEGLKKRSKKPPHPIGVHSNGVSPNGGSPSPIGVSPNGVSANEGSPIGVSLNGGRRIMTPIIANKQTLPC